MLVIDNNYYELIQSGKFFKIILFKISSLIFIKQN